MSLRLSLLEHHLPVVVRRALLRRLVRTTAEAFGVPTPTLPDDRDDAFVEAYARFTRAGAERVGPGSAAGAAVRDRLFAGAHGIGKSIRHWAGIRTPAEAVRALRLIYAAIGIDLHAELASRSVTVRRCAFADVYTPDVCRLVSALDAGLFHGISGAWCVVFTDRITDGSDACRGHLTEVSIP
jgi:hypothetical protein